MSPRSITFSVNDYDRDGDIAERAIYLHFGEVRVKVADSLEDFKRLPAFLSGMAQEIEENYPGVV